MWTSHSNQGRYGFFLCLEERARRSSIEGHFRDCVSKKFLDRGNFFSHQQTFAVVQAFHITAREQYA
jgi:hypothetical protein